MNAHLIRFLKALLKTGLVLMMLVVLAGPQGRVTGLEGPPKDALTLNPPDELLNRRVVLVISPGPNELLQTPFTMSAGDAADKLQPLGDDIAERLR